MGLFKNGLKNTFIKTPIRVAVIPGRVAIPKAVVQTHKYYADTLRKARAYRCPYCGEGQLVAMTTSSLPAPTGSVDPAAQTPQVEPPKLSQIWECNSCSEKLETSSSDINVLAAELSKSGREYYERGYAFQDRADALEDGRLLQTVESKIKIARGLRVVAIISSLFFFYGAYKGAFMFCITALLFSSLILVMGVMVAYRAWQLYTDNFFVADPKEQFHWWLSNESWFAYPSDYKMPLNAYNDLAAEDEYSDDEFEQDDNLTTDSYEQENIEGDLSYNHQQQHPNLNLNKGRTDSEYEARD